MRYLFLVLLIFGCSQQQSFKETCEESIKEYVHVQLGGDSLGRGYNVCHIDPYDSDCPCGN